MKNTNTKSCISRKFLLLYGISSLLDIQRQTRVFYCNSQLIWITGTGLIFKNVNFKHKKFVRQNTIFLFVLINRISGDDFLMNSKMIVVIMDFIARFISNWKSIPNSVQVMAFNHKLLLGDISGFFSIMKTSLLWCLHNSWYSWLQSF